MGLLLSSISNTLYQGEKFAACFMVTAVLWCLVVTLVVTLCLGIGLGYNYCFVDIKTKYKYISPRVRYPPPPDIEDNKIFRDAGDRGYTYPYHSRFDGYPYHYPYPGSHSLRIPADDEEATLPNLSGDDPDNITSIVTNASDTSNKTVSLPFNQIATSNDTLIKITLDPKSTSAVNTTEVSSTKVVTNTTGNMTTIGESTEKIDTEEGFSKISIPISGLDLIELLTRLRAGNRNYTLKIVT